MLVLELTAYLLVLHLAVATGDLCGARSLRSQPHPQDCRAYIVCWMAVPYLSTCPGDQLYDTRTYSCQPAHVSVCCNVTFTTPTALPALPPFTPNISSNVSVSTTRGVLPSSPTSEPLTTIKQSVNTGSTFTTSKPTTPAITTAKQYKQLTQESIITNSPSTRADPMFTTSTLIDPVEKITEITVTPLTTISSQSITSDISTITSATEISLETPDPEIPLLPVTSDSVECSSSVTVSSKIIPSSATSSVSETEKEIASKPSSQITIKTTSIETSSISSLINTVTKSTRTESTELAITDNIVPSTTTPTFSSDEKPLYTRTLEPITTTNNKIINPTLPPITSANVIPTALNPITAKLTSDYTTPLIYTEAPSPKPTITTVTTAENKTKYNDTILTIQSSIHNTAATISSTPTIPETTTEYLTTSSIYTTIPLILSSTTINDAMPITFGFTTTERNKSTQKSNFTFKRLVTETPPQITIIYRNASSDLDITYPILHTESSVTPSFTTTKHPPDITDPTTINTANITSSEQPTVTITETALKPFNVITTVSPNTHSNEITNDITKSLFISTLFTPSSRVPRTVQSVHTTLMTDTNSTTVFSPTTSKPNEPSEITTSTYLSTKSNPILLTIPTVSPFTTQKSSKLTSLLSKPTLPPAPSTVYVPPCFTTPKPDVSRPIPKPLPVPMCRASDTFLYPDLNSCNFYHECIDGSIRKMKCKYGYQFNPRALKCMPRTEANCRVLSATAMQSAFYQQFLQFNNLEDSSVVPVENKTLKL